MIRNRFFQLTILLFVLVNIAFNFKSWKEVFTPPPANQAVVGDSTLAEFILENNYQNIIKFKNPFIMKESLFYPYDVNLALNDPGTSNVVFYIFLRPFLSIHQSVLFIVLLNSFLANLLMYLLLVRLKIDKKIALVMSLAFGYMPVVSYRLLGHYTYTSIYIYPLIFLLIDSFLKARQIRTKNLLALGFGILMGLVLLHNFYYFITFGLGLAIFAAYSFFESRQLFFKKARELVPYSLIAGVSFLILLSPWLYAVYMFMTFEGMAKTIGFAGAIDLSADLVGFFTPSEYNPLYRVIISGLSGLHPLFKKYENFYLQNWETFVYPGLFILFPSFYLIFFKRKVPQKLWLKIKPYFYGSLFFAILTLGPFLKVFNRWALPLPDNLYLLFPLPFLLLRYIPSLSSVRAPTRFVSAFIFLGLISSAFLINHLFKKIKPRKKYLFLIALFLIFFLDQYYVLPKRDTVYFPIKSYNEIKKDDAKGTVLEIPFTIRDGFQYIGFVHAISPMNGSFYHHKPVIGGYFARINQSVSEFYKNLPFVGYVASIIDKGNYNPVFEVPQEIKITPFTSSDEQVKRELDFLDIKYVLLKNNEKYTPVIEKILLRVGFNKKLIDGEYDFYIRQIQKRDFEKVEFGSQEDVYFTAQGFSYREDGFRWTNSKISKVFLKTHNTKHDRIIIQVQSFFKPLKVKLYLNYLPIGDIEIETTKKTYVIDTLGKIKPGINTLTFHSSSTYQPKNVMPGSKDERSLGFKLFSLKMVEN